MEKFQNLSFGFFELQIRQEADKKQIFDFIRKIWVAFTPEEWVRQNLLHYLVEKMNYPKHQIGVEKQINVFNTVKRPDVIVFDKKNNPFLIIECKEPQIKISQKTFEQSLIYNIELKPKYLMLTNGLAHFLAEIKNKKAFFQTTLPTLEQMNF